MTAALIPLEAAFTLPSANLIIASAGWGERPIPVRLTEGFLSAFEVSAEALMSAIA